MFSNVKKSEFYCLTINLCSSPTHSKFILPPRSHHWQDIVPPPPPLPTSFKTPSSFLTEVLFITVPAQKIIKCPVNKNNHDSWTKTHREKASCCIMATSVEHLQELVSGLPSQVLMIDSIHSQINETLLTLPKGYKLKSKLTSKRKHKYIGVPSHIAGGYVSLLNNQLSGSLTRFVVTGRP